MPPNKRVPQDPFQDRLPSPERLYGGSHNSSRSNLNSSAANLSYEGDLGTSLYDDNSYIYTNPQDTLERSHIYGDAVPLTYLGENRPHLRPPAPPYPEEEEEDFDSVCDEIGGVSGLPEVQNLNLNPNQTRERRLSFDENEEYYGFDIGNVAEASGGYAARDSITSRPSSAAASAEWAKRQNPAQLKRYGTRRINLIGGQVLSAEYRVPTAIYMSALPKYRDEESGASREFSHMRYTAATCDPDDFRPSNGYNLRTCEYGRRTELLVTVTYYNEDKTLVARTLYSVMQNIRDICNLKRSQFWQRDGEAWKKIVFVIVMDGIDPCDKKVLDVLATMGIYQDGVMKKTVNGEETVAHVFEYTSQLCVTPNQTLVRPVEGNHASLPPIQFILCLKQQNSKKINSHRWVFNAFCPLLKPEVVCLIDAGTKPGRKSLLYLWQAFYNKASLGGACGEVHALLGKHHRQVLNPLVAAQNFEYKISNILDKPVESMFGYISVLPGAFSAYRYAAVEGLPLEQYFHGDHTLAKRLGKKGIDGMSIFRKNMFLAEDRILCLEVVFKRNCNWHLTYVKRSKAETDVPTGISELIGQRRRWLNGSFAAGIYAIMHFGRVYHSGHNPFRVLLLHIQFVFNVLQQLLSWFALSCYFLTITIIIELAANPAAFDGHGKPFPFSLRVSSVISQIVRYLYIILLMVSFILALGNRPKGSRSIYYAIISIFGIVQLYAMIVALYLAARAFIGHSPGSLGELFGDFFTSTTALVIIALASTLGLYIVSSILYFDPWHLLHSFVQYLFMMPSFVNILNVYAFCNWHDVSWGTKGSDSGTMLPEAKAIKMGEVAVVEEVERPLEDIDAQFQDVVKRALEPVPTFKHVEKASTEDQTKMFRTYLVIIWILSNIVLVWAITSTDSASIGVTSSVRKRIAYFFAVLLCSNAVVASVRFIGCVVFLTNSLLRRLLHRK